MKRIKRFLRGKQVEIVMCVLTALFTVLVLMMCGCTPTKRVVKADTLYKSETSQVDSTAQITRKHIDLMVNSVSELKETMEELLNENIDYTEQHYDSLGRLISNIRQTTNRNASKAVSKTDSTSIYIGLSVDRIDSILSARLDVLKSEITAKERIAEKAGLAWWQELLIWSGVMAWAVVLFFSIKFIIRFFWK